MRNPRRQHAEQDEFMRLSQKDGFRAGWSRPAQSIESRHFRMGLTPSRGPLPTVRKAVADEIKHRVFVNLATRRPGDRSINRNFVRAYRPGPHIEPRCFGVNLLAVRIVFPLVFSPGEVVSQAVSA